MALDEVGDIGEQIGHRLSVTSALALVKMYARRYTALEAPSLARRRALLIAALGFVEIQWRHKPAAVGALERWLHSWRGVGDMLAGMTAQGFNVELREFPEAWRANFYPVGNAHSIVMGSAWETTPWRAVQRAAWVALNDAASAAR